MAKRTLELNEVHVFKKVTGSPVFALAEVNPAMRLCQGDEALYIQHGKVFTPGGVEVAEKDLPGWFKTELQKCNPKVLAECGYSVPAEAKPLRSKRVLAQEAAGTTE